jgi:hypothetical protein
MMMNKKGKQVNPKKHDFPKKGEPFRRNTSNTIGMI